MKVFEKVCCAVLFLCACLLLLPQAGEARSNMHVGGRAEPVALTARDREMCARFRGNNYFALAREYGLTEMRVRQIVGAWQQEQFLRRQGQLPGLD
mgnify:CR=1 FL=1